MQGQPFDPERETRPIPADGGPRLVRDPGHQQTEAATLRGRIAQLEATLARREDQVAAMERDLRRWNTLWSLVEAMGSELDLNPLLQKMVVSAVELLGAEQGAIGLVDEERHAVRHQAVHNLPDALLEVDFTEGVGISGQVYAVKRPVIVRDYGHQVHLPLDDDAMRRIRAAVSVPIWWQGRLIGVFSIGSSDPERRFDDHDVDVLSLFATHAAIAIDNARLYADANRLAHVDERNRIARELHDSVTQSLFTIVLMADAVRNYLRSGQTDPAPTAEMLYQAARDALAEMRALIYELRPAALENEGLITALRKLAGAVQARHGLQVEVRQSGMRRLPPEHEEALFRIAHQALHNAVKHAQAGRAVVELRLDEDETYLSVSDDGVGFDTAALDQAQRQSKAHTRLGIVSMRERAEQWNGRLAVHSAPERGTQIEVRLPLRPEVTHGTHSSADRR